MIIFFSGTRRRSCLHGWNRTRNFCHLTWVWESCTGSWNTGNSSGFGTFLFSILTKQFGGWPEKVRALIRERQNRFRSNCTVFRYSTDFRSVSALGNLAMVTNTTPVVTVNITQVRLWSWRSSTLLLAIGEQHPSLWGTYHRSLKYTDVPTVNITLES